MTARRFTPDTARAAIRKRWAEATNDDRATFGDRARTTMRRLNADPAFQAKAQAAAVKARHDPAVRERHRQAMKVAAASGWITRRKHHAIRKCLSCDKSFHAPTRFIRMCPSCRERAVE